MEAKAQVSKSSAKFPDSRQWVEQLNVQIDCNKNFSHFYDNFFDNCLQECLQKVSLKPEEFLEPSVANDKITAAIRQFTHENHITGNFGQQRQEDNDLSTMFENEERAIFDKKKQRVYAPKKTKKQQELSFEDAEEIDSDSDDQPTKSAHDSILQRQYKGVKRGAPQSNIPQAQKKQPVKRTYISNQNKLDTL